MIAETNIILDNTRGFIANELANIQSEEPNKGIENDLLKVVQKLQQFNGFKDT